MELAKVTSKGQVTIPLSIRNFLNLRTGDKLFFFEEKGKVFVQNASQVALAIAQKSMKGEAKKAGFKTEEDVMDYIKELRSNS